MTLETLILAWALHFAPPQLLPHYPGHEETIAEATARYAEIAHDIHEAVKDRKDARSAAALALAWSIGESHLAHDADKGPCYRGTPKLRARCDSGAAATVWQLHEHRDRKTGEVIKLEAMFADRAFAARIAVRGLTGAWSSCSHLALEDRLSGFGLGHCEAGHREVRKRYKLWREVQSWQPPEDGPAASSAAMDIRKASDAVVAVVDMYSAALLEQQAEDAHRLSVQDGLLKEQAAQLEQARGRVRECESIIAAGKEANAVQHRELVAHGRDLTELRVELERHRATQSHEVSVYVETPQCIHDFAFVGSSKRSKDLQHAIVRMPILIFCTKCEVQFEVGGPS